MGKAPFDFAIAESCLRYDECAQYTAKYTVVLDVEYATEMTGSTFQDACRRASTTSRALSFEYRDLDLTPRGTRAWCS